MAFGSIFFPVIGRSSCKSRLASGMLYNTQCTQVPTGASGSSMISAKDCVPAGGSFHASGGEMLRPTHEYLVGMDCPLANASLVMVSWFVTAASVGVVFFPQADNTMLIATISRKIFLIPVNHLFLPHRIAG